MKSDKKMKSDSLDPEDLARLPRCGLFDGVDASIYLPYLEQLPVRNLAPGDILLTPEKSNDTLFILLSGEMNIHLGAVDAPVTRRLAPLDFLGSISVLEKTMPTAWVIAHTEVSVLPIKDELLWNLVEHAGLVARNLLHNMARIIRDNTDIMIERQLTLRELAYKVERDGLTGLFNRRWFDQHLDPILHSTREDGQSCALLMIDIDDFKRYNDQNGHLGGDQALVAMGDVMSEATRAGDRSVRYGGEEFALLLTPGTDMKTAAKVAERLRSAVRDCIIKTPEGVVLPSITVSIGGAQS
ncbi:MAG: GGDEF domain-containing protein [Verrucomicrobiota bacterium]